MIDLKCYNKIQILSQNIKKYNGYSLLETELLKRLQLCEETTFRQIMDFIFNESEVIYMLQDNPEFFLSLLDLGLSCSKTKTGSFSQLISILLSQSLYHRSVGFYLGNEETYHFLEQLMSIPNDKRKLNYHIRRIWVTLDNRFDDETNLSTSFIMALMNYSHYLTKDHFGMLPSDWFRKNASDFWCRYKDEEIIKVGYPTLSNQLFEDEINIRENLVKQFENPVKKLLLK